MDVNDHHINTPLPAASSASATTEVEEVEEDTAFVIRSLGKGIAEPYHPSTSQEENDAEDKDEGSTIAGVSGEEEVLGEDVFTSPQSSFENESKHLQQPQPQPQPQPHPASSPYFPSSTRSRSPPQPFPPPPPPHFTSSPLNRPSLDDDCNNEDPPRSVRFHGVSSSTRSRSASMLPSRSMMENTPADNNASYPVDCRRSMMMHRKCQSVKQLLEPHEAGEHHHSRWKRLARLNVLLNKTTAPTTTSSSSSAAFRQDDEQSPQNEQSDNDKDNPGANAENDSKGTKPSEGESSKVVYRIRSLRAINSRHLKLIDDSGAESYLRCYIRWAFRTTLSKLTLASYAEFLAVAILFALGVWLVGVYQPECIVGDTGFTNSSATSFVDAFALSWTTLSTVGYGIIAPAVYPENTQNGARCFGIGALMAIESFIGVLFGSILGAILVGKVARNQSIARVRFNSRVCVRYGSGVVECLEEEEEDQSSVDEDREDDNCSRSTKNASKNKRNALDIPCPILEFRLVNELWNECGGEIVNASVSVVATTLAEMDEAERIDSTTMKSSLPRIKASSHSLLNVAGTAAANAAGMAVSAAGMAVNAAGVAAGTAVKAAGMATEATMHVTKCGAHAIESASHYTGAVLFGTHKQTGLGNGTVFQRIINTVNHNPSSRSELVNLSSNSEDDSDDASQVDVVPYNAKQHQQEVEKKVFEQVTEQLIKEQQRLSRLNFARQRKTAVMVDEGNSSLAPTRIFHKLEIETDTHPFFRKVWNIRHRLDETSPLLTQKARRLIEENGGNWPPELNDHASVRKHLRFSELITSFSGMTNASGSSVYSQIIYDYADVDVGYTFAQILKRSKLNKIIVDMSCLDDVIEQNGGGAEPMDSMGVDTLESLANETQMAAQKATTRAFQAVKQSTLATAAITTQAIHKTTEVLNLNRRAAKDSFDVPNKSFSAEIEDSSLSGIADLEALR